MPLYTVIKNGVLSGIRAIPGEEEQIEDYLQPGESYILGHYPEDRFYLEDDLPVPRKEQTTVGTVTKVYSGDPIIISGLPENASVMALDWPISINQNTATVDTTGQEGVVSVFISAPQYLDLEIQITVVSLEYCQASVRQLRDALLTACDWTQLPDVPLETKAAWAIYRQLLRDIPNQSGFPLTVNWPNAPFE